ncbi:cystinosin homolog [Vicia villosa]|uniref:cystinosin homolog n=1 Tax=Vicia villosa TaxID=3911 RepID=UPI00273AEB2F|nr:cystinosin homolog [Vicia villosa]
MVAWNSFSLEIIYQVFGWLAFLSWSLAGYPQLISNFRRKSVVGLSLDYTVLNFAMQWSYFIYNASLFFSPVIQKQYFQKYGYGQMIPVAANDVALSTHGVIINLIILFQFAIYRNGSETLSKYAIAIFVGVLFSGVVCFFVALPTHSWLWLISIFNLIQVCMILIKYFPQALMNFMRKSTDGFSIGSILFDFSGGVFNYSQMVVQSIDQDSGVNFYGNIGKVMISLITIFYDSILMCQHYVLYPHKKALITSKNSEEIKKPLISSNPLDEQIHDSE